jgi:hypothetical protein
MKYSDIFLIKLLILLLGLIAKFLLINKRKER